jgi:adenosylcobinamide kinase/adenosylcobinamide-phosphate guanylyltransferase
MTLCLILGGVRSGKSRHAEALALARSDAPIYLATSRSWDEEHQRRIERHRRDRGSRWTTIEEPRAIASAPVARRVVVVECVTLWLTNFLLDAGSDLEVALAQATAEFERARALDAEWIFVSNEVGQGVHAPTRLGRAFADLQGFMNQRIAAAASRVTLMVAGIALPIKGGSDGGCP